MTAGGSPKDIGSKCHTLKANTETTLVKKRADSLRKVGPFSDESNGLLRGGFAYGVTREANHGNLFSDFLGEFG
jgi:hypothetical protein